MDSPRFEDPYVDADTGVLRNLVGARTLEELNAAEADLTLARATQVLEQSHLITADLEGLQRIHFGLFRDVYDWAGQIRTVDVRKDVPGAQYFAPMELIKRAAATSFAELHQDNYLKDLARTDFVAALAYHYEKINYIHPFREGNGRTQRIFWNLLTIDAGWRLDWRSVHGRENHEAARAGSDDGNLLPLQAMFDKIVAMPDPDGPTLGDHDSVIKQSSLRPHREGPPNG